MSHLGNDLTSFKQPVPAGQGCLSPAVPRLRAAAVHGVPVPGRGHRGAGGPRAGTAGAIRAQDDGASTRKVPLEQGRWELLRLASPWFEGKPMRSSPPPQNYSGGSRLRSGAFLHKSSTVCAQKASSKSPAGRAGSSGSGCRCWHDTQHAERQDLAWVWRRSSEKAPCPASTSGRLGSAHSTA